MEIRFFLIRRYFSVEIVDKIPPEELYQKFSPLHEASLQNAVGKLEKIYLDKPTLRCYHTHENKNKGDDGNE